MGARPENPRAIHPSLRRGPLLSREAPDHRRQDRCCEALRSPSVSPIVGHPMRLESCRPGLLRSPHRVYPGGVDAQRCSRSTGRMNTSRQPWTQGQASVLRRRRTTGSRGTRRGRWERLSRSPADAPLPNARRRQHETTVRATEEAHEQRMREAKASEIRALAVVGDHTAGERTTRRERAACRRTTAKPRGATRLWAHARRRRRCLRVDAERARSS